MSYDLMVFDPALAPVKRPDFIDWYDAQTEWEDADRYDDPAVATPALQAFYADLAAEFPPLSADGSVEAGTEYMIGAGLIYMGFHDWDTIDRAHQAVSSLAAKHAVGFFDVSSDLAEVWLPDGKGSLRVIHSE